MFLQVNMMRVPPPCSVCAPPRTAAALSRSKSLPQVNSFTAHLKIAMGLKGAEGGGETGGYSDEGHMKYMARRVQMEALLR
jgi:hypothetical protein